MKRLAWCLLVGAASAAACDGGNRPELAPTRASSPYENVDLASADLTQLIYWNQGRTFADDIPTPVDALFEAVRASDDDRWTPFLLDLVTIPTPFGDRTFETLRQRLGDPGEFDIFGWVETRGKKSPADDPEGYVEFKRALYSTIQPELGAFLNPGANRVISAQEVLWGGVRVDGIPPLESPRFETPAEASSWIDAADQVIGVEINGDARAYPRRIIDWHEMVNDTIGGVPVSLAYCTLCGSAILYDGRVGDTTFRFGTSGMLYRSNKLMYDRQTRTLWQQYSGTPVWGELAGSGIKLKTLATTHTSYGEWLAEHPGTKVLSLDTGFRRDYGSGVAYRDYFASPQLMFPAPDRSGPLKPKDVVYVVLVGGETVVYPIAELDERGLIQDRIGGTSVVVIATGDGSGGRAYDAGAITFTKFDRKKRTLSSEDGATWTVTESALVSTNGQKLNRLSGHNSFWFSVLNHTENGRIYQP